MAAECDPFPCNAGEGGDGGAIAVSKHEVPRPSPSLRRRERSDEASPDHRIDQTRLCPRQGGGCTHSNYFASIFRPLH